MKITNELKAGAFVAVTLVLFIISITVLGSERQLFKDQEPFISSFRDVGGLADGAPVRLGGVSVGRVDKVRYSEDVSDPNVHVTLLINEDYLPRIREDTVVTIQTQGLLGDKFLSITTGSANKKQLPSGSYIQSVEAADIGQALSKVQTIIDNTAEVSKTISDSLKEIKAEVVKNIADISSKISQGPGLMHRLIYSKEDGDKIINSLSKASDSLSDIMVQVRDGDGLLHGLVYGPGGTETTQAVRDAAVKFASAADGISSLSQEIKNGEGAAHQLIFGKSPGIGEQIRDVVTKLNATATSLKRISDSLSRGEGTIGALLVDPTLYENLVEVTNDAKRSVLLRSAIRSSLGK